MSEEERIPVVSILKYMMTILHVLMSILMFLHIAGS